MMASPKTTLHLTVMTPNATLFDGPVTYVEATSTDGSFGVLPQHQPMIRPLVISPLRVDTADGRKLFFSLTGGGVFNTDGAHANVLTDVAELADDIDLTRAEEARSRAEGRLAKARSGTDATVDVHRAEMALARSLARLKATQLR